MDIYEAVKSRYSCRNYSDKDVPEELLEKILEAARIAPSAKNFQRWRIIVVRDKETREKLIPAAKDQKFVGQAPVVLAFCSEGDNDHVMTCGHLSYPIDTAIIQDHVSLLATAEGLATCWIGAFYEDQVKEILDIPEGVRVVELMPLGYPADTCPSARNRLSLDEIVHREKW
ncbi:MAG: nitroreductase family protein [Planctomycetota bacterium]|jgi:nitroreductase